MTTKTKKSSEKEFTKDEFQSLWGEEGYYDNCQLGIGIDSVCDKVLYPHLSPSKTVLEIGCGGGVFTERIAKRVQAVVAIDVIKKPSRLEAIRNLMYLELPNQNYECKGVAMGAIDFAFSSGCFCHLPYHALKEYLRSVHKVLVEGGEFVFMISDWEYLKNLCTDFERETLKPNDFTSAGHFYQDHTTLKSIMDETQWEVISEDMIPEHETWDRYIHLKKK
jgi:cyclopropane fatty-acyl-phospholipid synthase-like methyltransferase